MSKLIYTSFSPNTRTKDLLVNLTLMFFPWTWLEGKYPKLITTIFESRFPNSKAFTFNYARSGMYVLFKSLKLKPQDEIIVQGYTCSAAINPILWAGAKPVYADIDKKTANISIESVKNLITKNTKAIIFQHTYGGSSGIEEIQQLCKGNNLLLIEDCTNTIFGKHKDKLIGSFGDASIFSFGRDKAVSGISGGVIVINNLKLLNSFSGEYEKLKYPTFWWTAKEVAYPINWFIIKLFYNTPIGKVTHFVLTKLNILTRATTDTEKKGQMPNSIPALLPNALAKLAYIQLLDIETLNAHRQKISEIYKKELADIEEVVFFESVENNVLLRFPFTAEKKKELVDYLKSGNIYVGNWYDAPITPTKTNLETFGYKSGVCVNSEETCKKIVNLPTHINISEDDAYEVVKVIKELYAN